MNNFEDLLEPLKYYENKLKDNFKEEAEAYFAQLTKEANTDKVENKRLVELYKKSLGDKKSANHVLIFYYILSLINIFMIVGFVGLFYYDLSLPNKNIIKLVIFALVAIASLFVFIKYLYPAIKKQKKLVKNYANLSEETKNKCHETMATLNSLFTSQMTTDLIRKVIPFINIDDNFNIKRFEQLVKNYGFSENSDEDSSTVSLISGEIIGNPFVFAKELVHEIIDYEYVGTRRIHYTEYYTDSEGHSKSRTVSETLVAKVYKPGPNYYNQTYLIYGNEAAPDLIFTREPQVNENDNSIKGLFDKYLHFNKRKIKKLEKEAIKTGGSFVAMANEEFEVKFAAFDRNNEQQFRLLFTPLAQTNMLNFLKNKVYGDDLFFSKNKMVNVVCCAHNQNWDIDNNPEQYKDYDYEECQKRFITLNEKYFQDMFFNFIPILSIPLYQQYKTKEYIYGHSFKYNYNQYSTEAVANAMDINLFKPQGAVTNTILKTSSIKSENDVDLVEVDAYSYRTEPRYDIVQVRAGNGRYYDVRVDWTLYIPINKTSMMEVSDTKLSENDYNRSIINANINKETKFGYKYGLFGLLTNVDEIDGGKIKEIFAQGGQENAKSIR